MFRSLEVKVAGTFFWRVDDDPEFRENKLLRKQCMILLIKSVKVANRKKRARQVKDRGITAWSAEGCKELQLKSVFKPRGI